MAGVRVRGGPSVGAAIAYARQHLVPVGYVPLALGFSVGEEARQWVSQGESGLGTMLHYVLIWRERNIDAAIAITGRVGVVSAFDVAPLARLAPQAAAAAAGLEPAITSCTIRQRDSNENRIRRGGHPDSGIRASFASWGVSNPKARGRPGRNQPSRRCVVSPASGAGRAS
jgi:hypothetical protein